MNFIQEALAKRKERKDKLNEYEQKLSAEADKKRESAILEREKKALEVKYAKKSVPMDFSIKGIGNAVGSGLSKTGKALSSGAKLASAKVKEIGQSEEWNYLQKTGNANTKRLNNDYMHSGRYEQDPNNAWKGFSFNPEAAVSTYHPPKRNVNDFWGLPTVQKPKSMKRTKTKRHKRK